MDSFLSSVLSINYLALTLYIPLIGFFIVTACPRTSRLPFFYAMVSSLGAFLAALRLIRPALAQPGSFTSQIDEPWMSRLIRLHMGVDGISLWLILLTTVMAPVAVWATERMVRERRKSFFAMLMLFEFGLIGVFSALDMVVFYAFWEIALVPMYLMVGAWGGPNAFKVSVKFFVYTMAGSLLMLGSILYIHSLTNSFDYVDIVKTIANGQTPFSGRDQMFIFFGLLAAFAVKAPIFPLHTWLPNTYAEAPMPATLLLAALMSKMGTYGLLRFGITLAPGAAHQFAPWIAICAIIGIVYGALLALVQPNIKRLIAYSSLSHIGVIVLGIFAFNQQGADGAVYQMLAHGVSTGALFLLAGYLQTRRHHSMEIADFGGVAALAPRLAAVFSIALFASIGLPTLCNFVGEFLLLQGAAIANFHWAIGASLGVILSAAYMLWMYQRTFLGKLNPAIEHFHDLTSKDWMPVVPLIVLMVWLGCYSQSFMPSISAATYQLLDKTNMNNQYRVKVDAPGRSIGDIRASRRDTAKTQAEPPAPPCLSTVCDSAILTGMNAVAEVAHAR
jgi:NADH-quinone oxidoreductase subunit M